MNDSPEMRARSPFLCRIGLHRWKFVVPAMSGTGCLEQCGRCQRRRIMSFFGAFIYEDQQ